MKRVCSEMVDRQFARHNCYLTISLFRVFCRGGRAITERVGYSGTGSWTAHKARERAERDRNKEWRTRWVTKSAELRGALHCGCLGVADQTHPV